MAITSVDTYLQHEIQTNLTQLLKNPYIIQEDILKDFDPEIKESFINSFCYGKDGKQKKELPVLFTFPRTKEALDGLILIQFKGATESSDANGDSLGMVGGVGNQQEGNIRVEKCPIILDTLDSQYGIVDSYFVTSQDIFQVHSFDNISVNFDDLDIVGNEIHIPYTPVFNKNMTTKITYSPVSVDYMGASKPLSQGTYYHYDLDEVYTIDSVSNNIDTLRCIDALLRTIFIFMRRNKEELASYRLQTLNFQGVDLLTDITSGTNAANGQQLYTRRIEVGYNVTESILDTSGDIIKSLHINAEEA